MDKLNFRQIHLDFHTSGLIRGVGSRFNKGQFQQALITGHVNAINLFAKCHHGYSYHFTDVNEIHPWLDFDLLSAQLEACKEINVATQIYISAGLDEKEAKRRPEWLARKKDETLLATPTFNTPGYHLFCYNTGYLDFLAAQVDEVMNKFHPDGLWLDISDVRMCYCNKCREDLRQNGMNFEDPGDVRELGERTYKKYAELMRAVADKYDKDCRIFHNAGHIAKGRRDLADMNTHFEAESLPTGGWGYDHFPLSAAYLKTLDKEYVAMTGKFHTTWGEFGGYKHPNALRYEASLALAMGAKCSIGDQLHPLGMMDATTYTLIGAAYNEVEKKEEYCGNVTAISDIGVLSVEAYNRENISARETSYSDVGANRMMLEGKYLYSFIDEMDDFTRYKLLILPDHIRLNTYLLQKLDDYTKKGGKILASGQSCMYTNKDEFAPFMGLQYAGENKYKPTYIKLLPSFKLKTNNGASFIMYSQNRKVSGTIGEEAAIVENPYFNRTADAFSSHQHTPNNPLNAGSAIILNDETAYIAYDIFQEYAQMGSLHLKEIVLMLVDRLLKNKKTIEAVLPDKAILTLNEQSEKNRLVLHILYAHTTVRGQNTEVIEDTVPLHDVTVRLRIKKQLQNLTLVPQNKVLEFKQDPDGFTEFVIPCVNIHQMVAINY